MSIINSGQIIKDSRKKAGLTQEYLSQDICSVSSLNKIENGKLGVSPSLFKLLMEKTGNICEAYPSFKNEEDMDCYILLQTIQKHINNWDLSSAYNLLLSVMDKKFANNKYYFQTALILYSWLQYRSYNCSYDHLETVLSNAIKVTKPTIDFTNINYSLSITECECLLLLANVYLNQQKYSEALCLLQEIDIQLSHNSCKDNYNNTFRIALNLTYSKYYLVTQNHEKAKQNVTKAIEIATLSCIYTFEIEAALLKATLDSIMISYDESIKYILYVAEYKKCGFINSYLEISKKLFNQATPLYSFDSSNYHSYPLIDFDFSSNYEDGIYDIFDKDAISTGRMLQILRNRQKISMDNLCQGICSKSRLSKIENGKLNPDIYTIEALLTRLGITEHLFKFYSNNGENQFEEIRLKMISSIRKQEFEKYSDDLEVFKQLADASDNKLMQQQYLIHMAEYCTDTNQALQYFKDALQITYPDINIHSILNNRLSKTELVILNGIARCMIYCKDPSETNDFINTFLLYRTACSSDYSLPQQDLFEITETLYALFLYSQNMYQNIVFFLENRVIDKIEYSTYSLIFLMYYYAISLAELGQTESMIKYSNIYIGLQYIKQSPKKAEEMKTDIYEEFNIQL